MSETDRDNKPSFSFGKEERICSLKAIEALFASGERFSAYPLFVVYRQAENSEGRTSVLFSVSKKRFKRAVDRNRVKRLMRESYRLNKPAFFPSLEEKGVVLHIAFVYVDNTLPEYRQVEAGMKKAMEKIMGQFK